MADLDLGADLRALRVSRGLSLGAAAARAAVAKSSLIAWESNRSLPRGPSLDRLLGALGADARLRARLLHAADPAHARIALAATPLGFPADVGAVVRAMRLRRGRTQADLARALGVSQGTVARWETGTARPSAQTVHAVGFALGASVEEVAALSCATEAPAGLPDDPGEASRAASQAIDALPRDLRDVATLGIAADVWARAVRDPRWDPLLCSVLGGRANELYVAGRHAEADESARSALRIEATPDVQRANAFAVTTLMEVALQRGGRPEPWIPRLERLAAGAGNSHAEGWLLWERALRLADAGRERDAAEAGRRGVARMTEGFSDADVAAWSVTAGMAEVYLRAGDGGAAQGVLDAYDGPMRGHFLAAALEVRARHARGEAAPEALLGRARSVLDVPDLNNWQNRAKQARIAREQARLAAVRP